MSNDTDAQLELFGETADIYVRNPSSDELRGKETCSGCNHILCVRFQQNLYFCSIQKQYGGTFGKKIKKSQPACGGFIQAQEDTIEVRDGYYGGIHGTSKR